MDDPPYSLTVIRVAVSHAAKTVTLVLPPQLDALDHTQLGRMVHEIARVREHWEPRGYAVSYGGRT